MKNKNKSKAKYYKMNAPTYTKEYIQSLPCWSCNKVKKSNRHLEFYNKDGSYAGLPVEEPIVYCSPCLKKLFKK